MVTEKNYFRTSVEQRVKNSLYGCSTFTALHQWLVPAVADEPTAYVVLFLCFECCTVVLFIAHGVVELHVY